MEGAEPDPMAAPEVVDEAQLRLGDALARLHKARNATATARKELDKFLRFVKDPDLERKLGLLVSWLLARFPRRASPAAFSRCSLSQFIFVAVADDFR